MSEPDRSPDDVEDVESPEPMAADEGAEDQAHERARLAGIIESLLFVAGSPLSLRKLLEVLNGPSAKEVKAALEVLAETYDAPERGVRLAAVAGGYQLRSAAENAEWVRALTRERPVRLGRAAMETLAIVAYKQPTTRAEIEAIRGVDADAALSSLLAKRLVRIAGRKETIGRPLLYTTTPEFLELFGLNELRDLPALKEIGAAPKADDDTAARDGDDGDPAAEDSEPGRSELAAPRGGADPAWASPGQWAGGDGAGGEGGPEPGSDHG